MVVHLALHAAPGALHVDAVDGDGRTAVFLAATCEGRNGMLYSRHPEQHVDRPDRQRDVLAFLVEGLGLDAELPETRGATAARAAYRQERYSTAEYLEAVGAAACALAAEQALALARVFAAADTAASPGAPSRWLEDGTDDLLRAVAAALRARRGPGLWVG